MKILYVTTIATTMGFFPAHLQMLLDAGCTVELACNTTDCELPPKVAALGLPVHQLAFSRNPLAASNRTAIRELRVLIEREGYDLVHTHTPNASVCVRLACRKLRRRRGLKVFYTAHGLHFYKGAPLLNWMVYYPIEKLCSRFTDTLITINHEDCDIARRKFKASRVERLDGIGVELERFLSLAPEGPTIRAEVRQELGLAATDKVLIYIAELNQNKNQTALLDVLAQLSHERQDVKLMLVGTGPCAEALTEKATALGLYDRLILTGYRRDVPRLLYAADVATPVSIREGFGLNIVEAMACGVPTVAFDNRGHRTIIRDGETGYLIPHGDTAAMAARISALLAHPETAQAIAATALASIELYSTAHAVDTMKHIYGLA